MSWKFWYSQYRYETRRDRKKKRIILTKLKLTDGGKIFRRNNKKIQFLRATKKGNCRRYDHQYREVSQHIVMCFWDLKSFWKSVQILIFSLTIFKKKTFRFFQDTQRRGMIYIATLLSGHYAQFKYVAHHVHIRLEFKIAFLRNSLVTTARDCYLRHKLEGREGLYSSLSQANFWENEYYNDLDWNLTSPCDSSNDLHSSFINRGSKNELIR